MITDLLCVRILTVERGNCAAVQGAYGRQGKRPARVGGFTVPALDMTSAEDSTQLTAHTFSSN